MKIKLFMAVSADGFIAKKNDDAPWSDDVWNEYYKNVKSYGNIIVGSRTYNFMKEDDEFSKLGEPFTVVLSRQNIEGIKVANNPKQALDIMEKQGFKDVYLGGGAKTNGAFLTAGLIDEIILDVEPFVFGRGIPLFSGENLPEIKVELFDTKQLGPQTVSLHYKVKK